MKTYLSRLNPAERRLVVGVGLFLFVAVNVFIVWPYYSKLDEWADRRAKAEKQLMIRQNAIKQAESVKPTLAKLERSGANIPREDQSAQFARTIIGESSKSGVAIVRNGRTNTRTNDQFFIEQEQSIGVQAEEENLVNFLYNLGQ